MSLFISKDNVATPQRLVEEPSHPDDRIIPSGPQYDAGGERLLDAVLDLDLESPMPAPVENLTAGSPYFQNGLVKVDLSWNKPDDNRATAQVCTVLHVSMHSKLSFMFSGRTVNHPSEPLTTLTQ